MNTRFVQLQPHMTFTICGERVEMCFAIYEDLRILYFDMWGNHFEPKEFDGYQKKK